MEFKLRAWVFLQNSVGRVQNGQNGEPAHAVAVVGACSPNQQTVLVVIEVNPNEFAAFFLEPSASRKRRLWWLCSFHVSNLRYSVARGNGKRYNSGMIKSKIESKLNQLRRVCAGPDNQTKTPLHLWIATVLAEIDRLRAIEVAAIAITQPNATPLDWSRLGKALEKK